MDIFFRAKGEADPLQFLRSVRLKPSPWAQLVPPPWCAGGQCGFGSDMPLLRQHYWKPLL